MIMKQAINGSGGILMALEALEALEALGSDIVESFAMLSCSAADHGFR